MPIEASLAHFSSLVGRRQGAVRICPSHPPSYAGPQKTPCGFGLVVVGRGVRSSNNDIIERSSLKISISYSRYLRTLLEKIIVRDTMCTKTGTYLSVWRTIIEYKPDDTAHTSVLVLIVHVPVSVAIESRNILRKTAEI
jgi:hypothetical protein